MITPGRTAGDQSASLHEDSDHVLAEACSCGGGTLVLPGGTCESCGQPWPVAVLEDCSKDALMQLEADLRSDLANERKYEAQDSRSGYSSQHERDRTQENIRRVTRQHERVLRAVRAVAARRSP